MRAPLAELSDPKKDKNMAPKLLLVDGYGFLFRAYHSLPPLLNPAGVPVGAVYGFINMLVKILQTHDAAYLAVIFDAGSKTFRNDLYEEYKANRPPAPDDLIPQFSIVRQAVEAFNIPAIDMVGYEADDLIATYAKQAVSQGLGVTILSSDKDLMQLVNDQVVLFDPLKSRIFDSEQVAEKFGVGPELMLDLLSLMGDSSDNIPGVPGIGIKTAVQLLNEFGSLDNVLDRAQEIPQKKRRESLIEYRDQALLSRDLVTLCETVPVTQAIDKMLIQKADPETLANFLHEHGFKSVVTKLERDGMVQGIADIPVIDPVLMANKQRLESNDDEPENNELITDSRALVHWLESEVEWSTLSLFLDFDKKTDELFGLVLSSGSHRTAYVPLLSSVPETKQTGLFDEASSENCAPERKGVQIADCLALLHRYLDDPSIHKIGYNIKRLLKLYPDHNELFPSSDDVMIMSYVCEAGLHGHLIEDMASHYLDVNKNDFKPFSQKNSDEQARADHYYPFGRTLIQLHNILNALLFDKKLNTVYQIIEKPLVSILAVMENNGIKVNLALLKDLSKNFLDEMLVLEASIYKLVGREFNIGSPKQLGEILFVEMELKGGKKSKKTGLYSTDVEVLESLSDDGVEIAGLIVQWRQLSKLKNTYSDALAKQIASDGRVHTHFSMASVNTGRLSSHNPNLQNIPVRTTMGNKIREVFIAEPNCKLISADYSQIELRLLAHMANIEPLKEAFKNEMDIHAVTASQIFGIPLEEVDEEHRRRAKAINFGIIYGMSAFGLAKRTGIERSEAVNYIDSYFVRYPGIRSYMDETKAFAKEHGYVATLFGRLCHIKGINDRNGAIRQFSERAAINAPLQGTAADIIKKAMIQWQQVMVNEYPEAKLLLQVHDELVVEAPESQVKVIASHMKKVMEGAVELSIPITVGIGVGDNWSEIH